MNYLGKYLKKRLKQLKMSEREISGKCGLSHSYLNQLIKGINPTTNKGISPTLKTFEKLSVGFDAPVETLQKIARGLKEGLREDLKEDFYNNAMDKNSIAGRNIDVTLGLSDPSSENKSRRGRKKKCDSINKIPESLGCSSEFIEQIRSFQSFMGELGFNKTKKTEEEWILIMSGIREALRKYIAKNRYSARKRISSVDFC
jgi:transcriptional regulator with XRE-family HTH domain